MLGRGAAIRMVLPGVLQVPLIGSSAFLLLDRRLTLIDTGLRGSAGRLLKAVRLAGRTADEIERIIITHYHPDHLGGLAEMQRLLPARTAIHAMEAPAVMCPSGPPSPFANRELRMLTGPLLRRLLPFAPVRVDEVLQDGDEFAVLGGLRVVHTPGHTPGHVALYLPQLRLLIAGDALEYRRERLRGPAPAFTADKQAARRSIRTMADLDIAVVAFSHFPPLSRAAGAQLAVLARSG